MANYSPRHEADLHPAKPRRGRRRGGKSVTDPGGPTVRRMRLGGELRRLRERNGLDQADAAKRLECSTSKISRLEKGKGLAKRLEILGLLDLYGVTNEDDRSSILEIHKAAAELGWWEQPEVEAVLPSGYGVYVGLEYDARAVRTWELGYVPGLLQTEAYARASLASDQRPAEATERLARVRLNRGNRLTAAAPLELWAVLDETVLRRPVGGAETMREQIRHLAEMATRPNITIQVYPQAKGAHPGLTGPFTILEFGGTDPLIGYVEGHAGNLFLERDSQTRALTHTFNRLLAGALDPSESAALLSQLAAEET